MGCTKTLEAFLAQGAQRTRSEEQRIVNDKQARRPLASGSVRNYERGVGLWRVYQRLNVGAKLNNYETPKAFILMTANAIDSRYGDPDAYLRTVRQYWKNTTAGLGREGEPVNPKIIESRLPRQYCGVTTGISMAAQKTVLICGTASCSTSSPLLELVNTSSQLLVRGVVEACATALIRS